MCVTVRVYSKHDSDCFVCKKPFSAEHVAHGQRTQNGLSVCANKAIPCSYKECLAPVEFQGNTCLVHSLDREHLGIWIAFFKKSVHQQNYWSAVELHTAYIAWCEVARVLKSIRLNFADFVRHLELEKTFTLDDDNKQYVLTKRHVVKPCTYTLTLTVCCLQTFSDINQVKLIGKRKRADEKSPKAKKKSKPAEPTFACASKCCANAVFVEGDHCLSHQKSKRTEIGDVWLSTLKKDAPFHDIKAARLSYTQWFAAAEEYADWMLMLDDQFGTFMSRKKNRQFMLSRLSVTSNMDRIVNDFIDTLIGSKEVSISRINLFARYESFMAGKNIRGDVGYGKLAFHSCRPVVSRIPSKGGDYDISATTIVRSDSPQRSTGEGKSYGRWSCGKCGGSHNSATKECTVKEKKTEKPDTTRCSLCFERAFPSYITVSRAVDGGPRCINCARRDRCQLCRATCDVFEAKKQANGKYTCTSCLARPFKEKALGEFVNYLMNRTTSMGGEWGRHQLWMEYSTWCVDNKIPVANIMMTTEFHACDAIAKRFKSTLTHYILPSQEEMKGAKSLVDLASSSDEEEEGDEVDVVEIMSVPVANPEDAYAQALRWLILQVGRGGNIKKPVFHGEYVKWCAEQKITPLGLHGGADTFAVFMNRHAPECSKGNLYKLQHIPADLKDHVLLSDVEQEELTSKWIEYFAAKPTLPGVSWQVSSLTKAMGEWCDEQGVPLYHRPSHIQLRASRSFKQAFVHMKGIHCYSLALPTPEGTREELIAQWLASVRQRNPTGASFSRAGITNDYAEWCNQRRVPVKLQASDVTTTVPFAVKMEDSKDGMFHLPRVPACRCGTTHFHKSTGCVFWSCSCKIPCQFPESVGGREICGRQGEPCPKHAPCDSCGAQVLVASDAKEVYHVGQYWFCSKCFSLCEGKNCTNKVPTIEGDTFCGWACALEGLQCETHDCDMRVIDDKEKTGMCKKHRKPQPPPISIKCDIKGCDNQVLLSRGKDIPEEVLCCDHNKQVTVVPMPVDSDDDFGLDYIEPVWSKEEDKDATNWLENFIDKHQAKGGKWENKDLNNDYDEWCGDQGIHEADRMNKITFGKFVSVQKVFRRPDANSSKYYILDPTEGSDEDL